MFGAKNTEKHENNENFGSILRDSTNSILQNQQNRPKPPIKKPLANKYDDIENHSSIESIKELKNKIDQALGMRLIPNLVMDTKENIAEILVERKSDNFAQGVTAKSNEDQKFGHGRRYCADLTNLNSHPDKENIDTTCSLKALKDCSESSQLFIGSLVENQFKSPTMSKANSGMYYNSNTLEPTNNLAFIDQVQWDISRENCFADNSNFTTEEYFSRRYAETQYIFDMGLHIISERSSCHESDGEDVQFLEQQPMHIVFDLEEEMDLNRTNQSNSKKEETDQKKPETNQKKEETDPKQPEMQKTKDARNQKKEGSFIMNTLDIEEEVNYCLREVSDMKPENSAAKSSNSLIMYKSIDSKQRLYSEESDNFNKVASNSATLTAKNLYSSQKKEKPSEFSLNIGEGQDDYVRKVKSGLERLKNMDCLLKQCLERKVIPPEELKFLKNSSVGGDVFKENTGSKSNTEQEALLSSLKKVSEFPSFDTPRAMNSFDNQDKEQKNKDVRRNFNDEWINRQLSEAKEGRFTEFERERGNKDQSLTSSFSSSVSSKYDSQKLDSRRQSSQMDDELLSIKLREYELSGEVASGFSLSQNSFTDRDSKTLNSKRNNHDPGQSLKSVNSKKSQQFKAIQEFFSNIEEIKHKEFNRAETSRTETSRIDTNRTGSNRNDASQTEFKQKMEDDEIYVFIPAKKQFFIVSKESELKPELSFLKKMTKPSKGPSRKLRCKTEQSLDSSNDEESSDSINARELFSNVLGNKVDDETENCKKRLDSISSICSNERNRDSSEESILKEIANTDKCLTYKHNDMDRLFAGNYEQKMRDKNSKTLRKSQFSLDIKNEEPCQQNNSYSHRFKKNQSKNTKPSKTLRSSFSDERDLQEIPCSYSQQKEKKKSDNRDVVLSRKNSTNNAQTRKNDGYNPTLNNLYSPKVPQHSDLLSPKVKAQAGVLSPKGTLQSSDYRIDYEAGKLNTPKGGLESRRTMASPQTAPSKMKYDWAADSKLTAKEFSNKYLRHEKKIQGGLSKKDEKVHSQLEYNSKAEHLVFDISSRKAASEAKNIPKEYHSLNSKSIRLRTLNFENL